MRHIWLLAGTGMIWSVAGLAAPNAGPAGADHLHGNVSNEIIVTAPDVRELDVLAGRSVLGGEALARNLRPQIGDTLARLPGVSATSFGPGASRPVLRGFQGERVRVLTDGIGSIDVSNTSADHAVTIDPLTAERIEVLRGPAVLLFGSQAIGGAVNVIDRRIPRRVPDEPAHVDALAAYGSAADEVSVGGGIDMPLGSQIVAHVDASWRDTDDLRIGGYLLSPELRALAAVEAGEGDDEAAELANARGRLPNSATRTKTLGGGLSTVNEGGSLGFSVGWFDTRYGVPERPETGHHEEGEEGHAHGNVSIGMEQIRFDVRGELNLDGPFEALRVRLGAADYEHTEFEGGEVGTVFKNNGVEGRIELAQAPRGGWRGVTGAQFFVRDLSALGEEAFLPANETQQYGLFTLQEFDLADGVGLEAAARYEHSRVGSSEIGVDRSFDAFSGALSASYRVADGVRIGITGSRAERAPSAEELFSNGPHVATQAFEVGDPNLRTEKAWGLEASIRAAGPLTVEASVYANWFDDFVYQAETGLEQDGLPLFRYRQGDARYVGAELQASAKILEAWGFSFVADGVADYVRATIRSVGPAPRIPPLRLLGGLEAQGARLDGRVEVEWADDQERLAAFETRTDGHMVLNASLAFRPFGRASATSLILSANNILDSDVRRHASFLKDFAPLAGRDVRLTARFSL